ncbi:putative EF-hand domain-containing calmodulin [Hamiltosporidium tvaerminnensis]|uniref:Putative EF-hand domain-containing calmodulin n=1 Tax=Hamiltosporidium tvaerminnensis TaxID=1176355 RepID=A0A4Q9LZE7_9MICR|nr:hypothetical protein LUQ84_002259 [Hamiltosporidium tvaerminnensis]TBU03580.1 putative EF-hand domain-containing calmodulin [Hamiltosporidium tvaerminnensis]TBU13135.1 putative EF-hand domain-containing calmodulin [Hamiltosporidium tvaerminnensis]
MEDEIKILFKRININKTGKISRNEFKAFLETLNPKVPNNEIEKLTQKIKPEGMNYELFETIMTNFLKECESVNVVEEVFNIFDKDGNGIISRNELKETFIYLGIKKTDKEIDKMVEIADINKDGGISLEEFKEVLNK